MSEVQNGTRSAEPIRASGYVRRVNRPDTRPLLTRNPSQKSLAMQEPSTQDEADVAAQRSFQAINAPMDTDTAATVVTPANPKAA